MPSLSTDQILSLAPDEASKKAGQALANSSKWQQTGSSDRSLWGDCQGSGSKPYQTVVEIATLTSKCSCPSRKFPCKHGLGLLLLQAKDASKFSSVPEPAWVAEWLDKRAQKTTAEPAERTKAAPDEKAQQKRQAARESKAASGLDELLLWMKDSVRSGLVQFPEKGSRFFEDISRRLIDAQLPGLARIVAGIGETNFYAEGWQTQVLDAFARLYLAISGYRNLGDARPQLMQELRGFMGFPQSADSLNEPLPETDWLVLSKAQSREGALTVEKYWLINADGQKGLFLQFLAPGAATSLHLLAGECFRGEVRYYKAAVPLRVQLTPTQRQTTPPSVPVLRGWDAVADLESQVLAAAPLLDGMPYVVAALKPVRTPEASWRMEDEHGRQMYLDPSVPEMVLWSWLAVSGGQYLQTAVLGAENHYQPLGVWQNTTYTPLL
ncbi:MAG: SWIM zinc finger family protein [Sphingobacteriales bacterium]|nr:MAG: SWIM zinc finger family protein [Sphingobacteriales bacterium]